MSSRGIIATSATLLALVLAGCGGDEPSEPPAPKPPTVYTLDQLEAALPGEDDVPGALGADEICPGGKDCPEDVSDGEEVSRNLDIAPPGADSAAEVEQSASTGLPSFADIAGRAHEDTAAAAADLDDFTQSNADYDGAFDTGTQSDGLREKGTGTVEKIEIGAWSGVVVDRTSSFPDDSTIPVQQTTMLMVVNGQTSVTVSVGAPAADDAPDFGPDLAEKLAAEYIERLG